MHEEPQVPNYGEPGAAGPRLTEGPWWLAIEPDGERRQAGR